MNMAPQKVCNVSTEVYNAPHMSIVVLDSAPNRVVREVVNATEPGYMHQIHAMDTPSSMVGNDYSND